MTLEGIQRRMGLPEAVARHEVAKLRCRAVERERVAANEEFNESLTAMFSIAVKARGELETMETKR